MTRFSDLSIKHKLSVSNIITSSIALLLASAAFMTLYVFSYKNAMIEDLTSKAGIVGINSTAAILFNDSPSAEETLSALKAEPNISLVFETSVAQSEPQAYLASQPNSTWLKATNRQNGPIR